MEAKIIKIDPDLHRRLKTAAAQHSKSLRQLTEFALEKALEAIAADPAAALAGIDDTVANESE